VTALRPATISLCVSWFTFQAWSQLYVCSLSINTAFVSPQIIHAPLPVATVSHPFVYVLVLLNETCLVFNVILVFQPLPWFIMSLSIYLSISCCTALCWALATFSILYTVGMTPWTGDQPVARPLPIHRTTQRINAYRHPCFEWDWNPRFQCSSERRQFMPEPARPLWPADYVSGTLKCPYFLAIYINSPS
jgi:hypothetical protein